MKKEKISDILNKTDDKYIYEATVYGNAVPEEPNSPSENIINTVKTGYFHKKLAFAAGFVLLFIAASFTALALVAEAMEYNAAVAFFEEKGLSLEGLSRSDVKSVYQDITTRCFVYDKTSDVIYNSVLGREIIQDEPTPEELARMWDENTSMNLGAKTFFGFRSEYDYVREQVNHIKNIIMLNKSILNYFSQDGTKKWTAEFLNLYTEGSLYTENGSAVWGRNITLQSDQQVYAWLSMVDDEGNILWTQKLSHGFHNEHIYTVFDNGDGTWAVISCGDSFSLCLTVFDLEGNEILFRKNEIGDIYVWNAARLGDGYIVQAGNESEREMSLIYKMNSEGEIVNKFTYSGENCDYFITDMIEFGDRIWISAYSVPSDHEKYGRSETATIEDYIYKNGRYNTISGEELTPILRDNYTAVIMICEPEGGSPEMFYSVKGSLGGDLELNSAGLLEWTVYSITSSFYSPVSRGFTFGGACRIFRYSFDSDGILVNQTDTGETEDFYR